MSVECRLCGSISPAKIQLSDKIKGTKNEAFINLLVNLHVNIFQGFYHSKSLSSTFVE